MKKLNELVELAEKARFGHFDYSRFAEAIDPETILAISEAFRALERDNQMILAGADWMDFMAETTRKALERAEAAEAKLSELEKQEPYGFTHNHLAPPDNDCESIGLFKRENRHYGRPLFTRPAPAVSMAALVPRLIPKAVYDVIYQECGGFVESNANAQTIWTACRAAILSNIEAAK